MIIEERCVDCILTNKPKCIPQEYRVLTPYSYYDPYNMDIVKGHNTDCALRNIGKDALITLAQQLQR